MSRCASRTTADGRHRDVSWLTSRYGFHGVDVAVLLPVDDADGDAPADRIRSADCDGLQQVADREGSFGSDRLKSFAYLPFNDPEASYQIVQEFKDVPGIVGFLITSVRHNAVHDNVYAKTYAAIQGSRQSVVVPHRIRLGRPDVSAAPAGSSRFRQLGTRSTISSIA